MYKKKKNQVEKINGKNLTNIKINFQKALAQNGTTTISSFLKNYDLRFPNSLAMATVTTYGKGKIAAIYANIGDEYTDVQSPQLRDLVGNSIESLFANPIVRIEGSKLLHTVIAKKDGHLFIHLINTNGGHNNPNVLTYDEVTAVGPVTVKIRLAKKPASIVLQPEHT